MLSTRPTDLPANTITIPAFSTMSGAQQHSSNAMSGLLRTAATGTAHDAPMGEALKLPHAMLLRLHGPTSFGALGSSALEGLRGGDTGGSVGLLPSLRFDLMDRFTQVGLLFCFVIFFKRRKCASCQRLTYSRRPVSFYFCASLQVQEDKRRRAPREDLTGLTPAQMVERRKARARVYSSQARDRWERHQRDLENAVTAMRMFKTVVEEAPHMLIVLSMDVTCLVLYANMAVTRCLSSPPVGLLGR